MDILFNNPLANLSGGWFLLFYATTIIITAIAFWLYKSSLDWTGKLPLPLVSNNPDPFEIAYLRGGENEFARTVIFSLVQKKFLEIISDRTKSHLILTGVQPNWTTLSEMEREVLKYFQQTRESSEVFGSFGVSEILEPYSLQYETKIEQSKFLMPKNVQIKTRSFAVLVGLAVSLVGVYKIIAALMNGKTNVIFAIVLTVIGFIIFLKLGKVKRLSALGQRYVERIQQAFDNLKVKIQTQPATNQLNSYSSMDPFLLTVGVFGVGALAGTAFNNYEAAFHRSNVASGDSSCGSGCGSSSCSSGGDGGGGGCGGCGGGD